MSGDDNLRIAYLGNVPSSNSPILSLIFVSIIFNILLYKILPSSLTPFIKSYIISTFHAWISVISVINHLFRYKINFKQINRIVGGGINGSGDEMMIYNVCYTTGYLIYDLLLMCRFKSVRTNSAIIHHILILLSFFVGLYFHVCHPCHFYFLAEELSTIPLNLKTIYHDNPHLHHIFSLFFVFCFFLSRIIYGTIICAYGFRAAPEFLRLAWNFNDISIFLIGLIQALLCILTRLLNFYWAFLILKKLFFSKISNEQKKNS